MGKWLHIKSFITKSHSDLNELVVIQMKKDKKKQKIADAFITSNKQGIWD